jgi:hypothetical protein
MNMGDIAPYLFDQTSVADLWVAVVVHHRGHHRHEPHTLRMFVSWASANVVQARSMHDSEQAAGDIRSVQLAMVYAKKSRKVIQAYEIIS